MLHTRYIGKLAGCDVAVDRGDDRGDCRRRRRDPRAQGWRTLAALYGALDTDLERALQRAHSLSVVSEYTVLDALSRQDGWHMRMSQLTPGPPR